MYACLACGFIHSGKTKKVRVDKDGGGTHYPSKPFHGFITHRTCPKCKSEQYVESFPDKTEVVNESVKS